MSYCLNMTCELNIPCSWTWVSSSIVSYANAVVSFTSAQLSSISSIETSWDWSYSGTVTNADVAYDCFTSSSAGGSNENEIVSGATG
jgi:xyloglucan-specific endo-beta-1,4-glucanase